MTKATSKNEPIEELDIATVDPMAKKAGKEFPGWLYGVLFVLFDAVGVAALQIGVSESATRVQLSNNMWLTGWGFVGKMFTSANFVAALNLILWGVLYVILLMLTNRFWVATPIFLAVTFIVAVIEHFKVSIRYEAILPSDLNFLKADAGNLMSFMPSGAQWTILIAVAAFAAFVALFVFLNRLDARHGRLFRGSDKQSRSVNAIARLLLILLPGLFFTLYSMQQYRTRYLLARLTQHVDMAFSGVEVPGSLEPFTKLEIEHILPDNPKAELRATWAAENPNADYDDYKNRLGNLTLLEKPINIVAGNDFYTAKQVE